MEKNVYLVKQFQEQTELWDTTIHVFSNKESAEKKCEELNEEFEDDQFHYYETETMELEK